VRFGLKILLALLLILPALALPARAEERPGVESPGLFHGPTPIEKMVGESFSYDIAFLWFNRLAEGELSFHRGKRPGTYEAVLEARTLGVAAWLTGDRAQRYVSEMEVGEDGRLKSLVHESHILKGKGDEREDRLKRYIFDYADHLVRQQVVRNGKTRKEETFPLGENPPNDILTAFYNLRAGFFGPVVPGAHYRLPAFSRKGNSDIEVEILDSNKQIKNGFFPQGGLLARVTVDPEVFDTGGGSVYVWFNNFGQPCMGIVENVLGMGDVRGRLQYSRTEGPRSAEN
jgi:hypothetical protein